MKSLAERPQAKPNLLFGHVEPVPDLSIIAVNVLPKRVGGVHDVESGVSVMFLVEIGGDVQSGRHVELQSRVRLDVSRHTVDQVSYGLAVSGDVSVVVDVVALDDRAVVERVHSLVPVNVASKVGVHSVFEHGLLEGISHVSLVACNLGRVHGSMSHGKDPWSLGSVDGCKVCLEPVDLLVVCVDLGYQPQPVRA